MDTVLVLITPAPVERANQATALVASFLAGQNERTLRAYRNDLEGFYSFLRPGDVDEAARILLSRGHWEANALVLAYHTDMVTRKLHAATINRRLAAVCSLVKLTWTLRIVPWSLEVEDLKAQAYRDTRGPGRQGFLTSWKRRRAGQTGKPSGTAPSSVSFMTWPSAARKWCPWTWRTWTWKPGPSLFWARAGPRRSASSSRSRQRPLCPRGSAPGGRSRDLSSST